MSVPKPTPRRILDVTLLCRRHCSGCSRRTVLRVNTANTRNKAERLSNGKQHSTEKQSINDNNARDALRRQNVISVRREYSAVKALILELIDQVLTVSQATE
ncbi:hypothetical protein KIN20_019529 [Parelaphostrongylus tenuis]|uniref:Uncharacterized protein n=1 Tax=Parelaphostrongylus tenuis TaxID=148309 RepID=A0AAD5QT17_PARTN|nr:hypothetical protein KIN20_019529 [Parelaphostrongylus tenuis]